MKVSLRLTGRHREGEDVTSFLFLPDQPFSHEAGQHLRLTIAHATPDSRGASRYFTISSAPPEPHVMITTRLSERPSTFKYALTSLDPGAVVEAVGPSGRFVYPPGQSPALFIAGGIGVTPFRSILIDLTSRPEDSDVILLYANRTDQIPFRARLDELVATRSGLKVIYTVTQPTDGWQGHVGRIDSLIIKATVPDLVSRVVYVSGPRPMVETTVDVLSDLGIDPGRIKQEVFSGYE